MASQDRPGTSHGRRPIRRARGTTGKLRIGDDWNAITIIALSQNNPLKAIAEFVENSIDARARSVTIIRGKERGEPYLKIVDDGEGIPRDESGAPDFRYVATHIGASLKKRLKEQGMQGIQGEFGIGLLSFWTVGERMALSSASVDGRTHVMEMRRNEPGYTLSSRRVLFTHQGTELLIRPLLPGLRQLSGEKIQSYLASELRDRIRMAGVRIRILDRGARKDLEVQPRQFSGRLLHEIGPVTTSRGEIYLEVYLNAQDPANQLSLYRRGSRVVPSLSDLETFAVEPWTSGYFQGLVDAPFLQLTPGTRTGVVLDDDFQVFREALAPVESSLMDVIALERQAEEEQASRDILKAVQKAFREAFLSLPPDEYDWFGLHSGLKRSASGKPGTADGTESSEGALPADEADTAGPDPEASGPDDAAKVRDFFEFPGPLYSAFVSPASTVVRAKSEASFRCVARDRSRRVIDEGVQVAWRVAEGEGRISADTGEIITFTAPEEPGLCILEATATQGDLTASARAVVTVSETLIEHEPGAGENRGRGLPGYTFQRVAGELWRSRFDEKNNLVVINNGHRDYRYAAQKHARKLRYICRLFSKELVLANFPGFGSSDLLERMIELSMYTEEHLK
ncbi:MAG: ATP-binding protein [Spirochaetes bacterium]|nr:ATP-binding protein [Spirochaetota bacterium]